MSLTTMDAQELKMEVSDFLRIVTISPSTFGRYAVSDPVFTHRLADQESVRITTVQKVRQYMINVLDGAKDKSKIELKERISNALGSMVEAVEAVETMQPTSGPPANSAAAMLLEKIDAYLVRNPQMTATQFGKVVLRHAGFVGLLRKRGTLKLVTAQRVLDFIAEYPDGYDGTNVQPNVTKVSHPVRVGKRDVPGIKQQPALEANSADTLPATAPIAKRHQIRQEIAENIPSCDAARAPPEPLSGSPVSLGARFQEIALEDSSIDAVRTIQNAWPATWRKLCQRARDQHKRPVNLMIEILEGACDG